MAVTVYLKSGQEVNVSTGESVEPGYFPYADSASHSVYGLTVKDKDGKDVAHFASSEVSGFVIGARRSARMLDGSK